MRKAIKKIIFILLVSMLALPMIFSCSRRKVDLSNYKTIEEFDNKDVKIGVIIGTNISVITEKVFKNAKIEYFSGGADLFNALKLGKIDATIQERYALDYLYDDNKNIKVVDNIVVGETKYALGFPKTEKGEKLCSDFNEFLQRIKSDGTMQKMMDIWFPIDLPEDLKVDLSDLENINGELTMYTDPQVRPFSFSHFTRSVGLDLDLARAFCKEKGYALSIVETSSAIPALISDKCDLVGSGLEITDEREKSILFSEPTYVTDDVIVISDSSLVENIGIINELKVGFVGTFISEDRYKLFISGAITTIIISVMTLILGTVIGFLLYLANYIGYTFIARIFNFLSWLFKRLPLVVFLMFILYVVFAKVDIDGIIVAIISFTIVFATTVFSLIDGGVQGIDYGQIEAASALGYNKMKTFFKIIIPQILPGVLPLYQSEILGLVNSTAIVGYVMVYDLTKAGDIVRSRTFGAFFPLVAVAIIYIVLAKVITVIVKFICDIMLKKLRFNKDQLKGIKTDD